MISTSEAGERLGVSAARVRALLDTGAFRGAKIGRTWAVDEASVAARLASPVQPGRPRREHAAAPTELPKLEPEALHRLYDGCREQLAGSFGVDAVRAARTPEEARFYMAVASFFLQERQRALIDEGVF